MELPRRRTQIKNVTGNQVQYYVGPTSNQILEVNDVTMSSLCLRFLFFLCLTNVLASMPQVVLYPETEKPGLYNCYRISHSKQMQVKNNQTLTLSTSLFSAETSVLTPKSKKTDLFLWLYETFPMRASFRAGEGSSVYQMPSRLVPMKESIFPISATEVS